MAISGAKTVSLLRFHEDMDGFDSLFLAEYRGLRSLAAKHLRKLKTSTLQPTALVHEVYLKLLATDKFADRAHFICTAATAMRHILVDHARRKGQLKRGGGLLRVTLALSEATPALDLDLLALNTALDQLRLLDERQAQIVDLRFFAGFGVEEAAELLGLSERSVKRDWAMARAWLQSRLAGDASA